MTVLGLPRWTLFAASVQEVPGEPLVHAALRGDVAAFEQLYRTHVGRVHALCLRLVADRAHAEQLTQDAFVRAWEKLRSFRGESAFATWLRHVTVNVVLEDRRATARRTRRIFSTANDAVLESSSTPRHDDVALDLERALARLPEGPRTVFVLHDVEGYQHQEIGDLLGIAEGTSKAHLHRARTLLKEVLR